MKAKTDTRLYDAYDYFKGLIMNNEEVSLNEHFIWTQKRIKELNQDRRTDIMDYEMKMMDREIYGREIGEKVGEKRGKEIATHAGVKKLIATIMKFSTDSTIIFDTVKEQYGEYFSDDELKQFIAEVKTDSLQEAWLFLKSLIIEAKNKI